MTGPEKERPNHSRGSVYVWGSFPQDRTWMRLQRRLSRGESFYVAMLWQDLESRLHLGGYGGSAPAFGVRLQGDDTNEVRKLLTQAFGQGDRERDLEEAVRSFFQRCGVSVLLNGSATYEIDYLSDSWTGRIKGFHLAEVPTGSVVRRWGSWYQYLPADFAQRNSLPRRLRLNSADLIHFRFDSRTRRHIDSALNDLVKLNQAGLASVDLLVAARDERIDFSVSEQHELIEKAVARVTSRIGWDARQSLLREWSEPFLVYRALRFKRFSIELRDLILARVNECLRQVGLRLGMETQMTFSGLQDISEIDQAISDIATAQRPFDELAGVAVR